MPEVLDWMYEGETRSRLTPGGYQVMLTLGVAAGIETDRVATRLLGAFEVRARKANRQSVLLTCLTSRVPFYEQAGYHQRGPAATTHGQREWVMMEKALG